MLPKILACLCDDLLKEIPKKKFQECCFSFCFAFRKSVADANAASHFCECEVQEKKKRDVIVTKRSAMCSQMESTND